MKKLFVISIFLANVCSLYSQSGWQQQYISLGSYSLTSVFPVSGNVCYASGEYNTTFENYYSIYKTSNNGSNWVQVTNGTGWLIKKLWFSDSLNGYAAGGLNWTSLSTGISSNLNSLFFLNADTGWAAGANAIIQTTNGGQNWTAQFSKAVSLSSIVFYNKNTGWSCGGNYMLYTVTGGLVNINNISSQQILSYKLKQNYPNPFNPQTVINYELESSSHVVLSVYDINGKEAETLVSGFQKAGKYEIEFNGTNYSSGVYFYRIKAGNNTTVKKMTLLK